MPNMFGPNKGRVGGLGAAGGPSIGGAGGLGAVGIGGGFGGLSAGLSGGGLGQGGGINPVGGGGGFGAGGGGYQRFNTPNTPRGVLPGAGGGGAGGGGFGAPVSTQIDIPEFQQYQGYQPNEQFQQNINQLAEYGQGLMDPNSAYYQQLQEQMTGQIGKQAAAGQRASAVRGAWSGFGAGASPEQMATSADIGQAGLEAAGQASADLALQAPQIGAGMLQSTFQPQLGLEQLGEQSSQFGAGLAEQARQYGGNLGLAQQQLAAQQAYQQGQLQLQGQQNQLLQQQMMAQMANAYGRF